MMHDSSYRLCWSVLLSVPGLGVVRPRRPPGNQHRRPGRGSHCGWHPDRGDLPGTHQGHPDQRRPAGPVAGDRGRAAVHPEPERGLRHRPVRGRPQRAAAPAQAGGSRAARYRGAAHPAAGAAALRRHAARRDRASGPSTPPARQPDAAPAGSDAQGRHPARRRGAGARTAAGRFGGREHQHHPPVRRRALPGLHRHGAQPDGRAPSCCACRSTRHRD